MREIKFRQRLKKHFWHNDEKFHYWGYINDSFVSPMGKNDTVGDSEQFIGIQCDGGCDIYDGDKIKKTAVIMGDQDFLGVVKFREGSFWIDNGRKAISVFCETAKLEVIGNIHENPELLENK